MSKTLDNSARTLLEELDAEAKSLGERIQIVNATRAQIRQLLGKPATELSDKIGKSPAADKSPRERKSPLREGLEPGEQAVIGAVIGKVIDGAAP
jgi:hypothetical protein